MTIQNQLLLEKLQGIYNRAISNDAPRFFFLALFEFLEVYDQEPILQPVMKTINAKGDEDNKKLQELETKTLTEIEEVYQQVKKYVEEQKITARVVLEHLDTYIAYKENRIESSSGSIEGRHGAVAYILMCLAQDASGKYKEFPKQYGQIQENGFIESWNFAPSYYLWKEEKAILDRLKLTKIWFSWDRLVYFYRIYKDFEKLKKEKADKNQWLSVIDLNLVFDELNSLLDYKQDTKRYLRTFDVGNYKVHLQRVFTYTKEFLQREPVTKQIKTRNAHIPYIFNEENTTLSINGKQLKFKKDTRKLLMLRVLMKKPNGIYYTEIVHELEGAENAIKDPKNTYYEVCRGINTSLLKIGISDFLEYDFNQTKINSLYKKATK